jgi:hypothetical protein
MQQDDAAAGLEEEGQAREPWQARHWQQKQLDSTRLTAAAVSSYERLRIAE